MNYCFLNNDIIQEEEAKISTFDKGFLYGYGIYEVIHVFGTKLWQLDKHINRIYRSAQSVKLELPASRDELKKILITLAKKNKLEESYIWINLTLDNFLIFQRKSERPTHVGKVKSVLAERVMPHIKTTSSIGSYLARESEFDDALLINREGFATEGATSNIFIIKDGNLITTTEQALEGVMQSFVIEMAKGLGISTSVKRLKLTDIKEADEVFITSTNKFILPIGKVDDTEINDYKIGPITQQLYDELENRINGNT